MPETVDQCKKLALPGQGDAFAEQMLDIHGERLEIMTQYNVELFVLSLASPGPQGQHDKEKAEVSVHSTWPRTSPMTNRDGVCRVLLGEPTTIWQRKLARIQSGLQAFAFSQCTILVKLPKSYAVQSSSLA